MSETVTKTKTELLSEMREHQAAYAKAAAEYKHLISVEEAEAYKERQLKRLEEYKGKYTLFVSSDGSTKEIDWVEVEKLIRSSFDTKEGYGLGFDATGQEGLGVDYGTGGAFTPMVEDEADAKRFMARKARQNEYEARNRKK